jgi:uncharacterized protein involved in type VI secretion and phage assembly
MPDELLKWLSGAESREAYSIAPGIVSSNFDLTGEGRIQVRLPSFPAFEPWARLVVLVGGSGRGFLWMPELKDEVLVAFNQNDERDAYILGGLWNTKDRPPGLGPTDFFSKRILRTGKLPELGHEIEFDEVLQSITITTAGLTSAERQQIVLDPTKIELSNLAGTVTITLDNKTQSVSISAPKSIELKAGTQITLQAGQIDIQGLGQTNITGAIVNIN